MSLTRENWRIIGRSVEAIPNCPLWLKHQLQLQWEVISELPDVDQTVINQSAVPTVEIKEVASDYLSFLREQIELSPRGPEWSDILKRRLTALEPLEGKQLIVASFFCKPHSATLRIIRETGEPVHMETN